MNPNMDPDIGKGTQFQAGQTGNPNGRPRTKPMTDALKALLDKDDAAEIGTLLKVAMDAAKDGDFRFWKEIMDRSDGKVMEMLDVTTDGASLSDFPGLSKEDMANLAKMRGGPGEDQ